MQPSLILCCSRGSHWLKGCHFHLWKGLPWRCCDEAVSVEGMVGLGSRCLIYPTLLPGLDAISDQCVDKAR